MTRLISLDAQTFVAGQITPADIPDIAAAGIVTIVNNRPDFEEPGQPLGADIRAVAEAAGLAWRDIPIAGGLSRDQVAALAEALDQADGKTLLFCRSGTRSTYLWALARVSQGAGPEELVRRAEAAGYDLTPIISPNPPR